MFNINLFVNGNNALHVVANHLPKIGDRARVEDHEEGTVERVVLVYNKSDSLLRMQEVDVFIQK